jgi:hypothetical protein
MQWIHFLDHKLEPQGGGSTASEMLVPNLQAIQHHNPENHDVSLNSPSYLYVVFKE